MYKPLPVIGGLFIPWNLETIYKLFTYKLFINQPFTNQLFINNLHKRVPTGTRL